MENLRPDVEEAEKEGSPGSQGDPHHQTHANSKQDATLGISPGEVLFSGSDLVANHHATRASQAEKQRKEKAGHHLHDLGGGGGHHALHAVEKGVHAHADGPENFVYDHGQDGLDEAPQKVAGEAAHLAERGGKLVFVAIDDAQQDGQFHAPGHQRGCGRTSDAQGGKPQPAVD